VTYKAPLSDIFAALDTVGLEEITALPAFEHVDRATVELLLTEFARFVEQEIAPLDRIGDAQGSTLHDGRVRTPTGWRDAYRRYVDSGWGSVPFPRAHHGGGFPWLVGVAMQEILDAGSLAFSLCPMLTQSAIELLMQWGTPDQRRILLPRLVSGEWTGTMNLTEPDAGSDVGALRATATPNEDGTWSINGTKVFITWGDHDLTENIVHLVLARAPGAQPGTAGISLFAAPAHHVAADGTLGTRNRVECLGIERKLGIHASPTCTLAFDGAIAELVGDLHGGMRAMFAMMNTARLAVGIEGLAVSTHAHQLARDYASRRYQGNDVDTHEPVPIARHPDVQRMLWTMQSKIDVMRLLTYSTAAAVDRSRHQPDANRRAHDRAFAELLVPLAKAWPTDTVNEVTSLAIQVHGGVGFIEESGVAQLSRDARITSIYEGTNGIQAMDLARRKLGATGQQMLDMIVDEIEATCECASWLSSADDRVREELRAAALTLRTCVELMVERRASDHRGLLSGATPFLELTATTVGAWLLARHVATIAQRSPSEPRLDHHRQSLRFYATQILPGVDALRRAVESAPAALPQSLP
jgi:alkylation response protein AidB-like acyl-CoA dehydrogenase